MLLSKSKQGSSLSCAACDWSLVLRPTDSSNGLNEPLTVSVAEVYIIERVFV